MFTPTLPLSEDNFLLNRASHEWQAYISRTHSLRKTYIGVEGIYYQADVQAQKITWLTPHALQQVLFDEVDLKVMLTFLEFYGVTSLCNGSHIVASGFFFLLSCTVSSRNYGRAEFGRTHVVRPKGKHQATIVWLHGLGDNGS
ncbi:hypothetical protein IFM89_024432, partial [Coptis chinensis]